MPTVIIIKMQAEKDFWVPRFTGNISRALILHFVKRASPKLAQDLHEFNKLKPYATEPIYFKSKEKTSDGYLVDSSYPSYLVVKLLSDDSASKFIGILSSNELVMIRENKLVISELKVENTPYAKIMEESKEFRRISIAFKTPTYFSVSRSDFYSVFPEPRTFLMNILRIWNAFSSFKLTGEEYSEYRKWCDKHFGVVRYELRTMPLVYERSKAKFGFLGEVDYIVGKDKKYSKFSHALISFARFSNVGGGRTAGMGVINSRILDSFQP